MPVKTESGEYVIFVDKPEGNAMVIQAIVCDMLRQIWGEGSDERIDEYKEKAESGDYENLKKVSVEAVPGLITFGNSNDYNVVATKKEIHDE